MLLIVQESWPCYFFGGEGWSTTFLSLLDWLDDGCYFFGWVLTVGGHESVGTRRGLHHKLDGLRFVDSRRLVGSVDWYLAAGAQGVGVHRLKIVGLHCSK